MRTCVFTLMSGCMLLAAAACSGAEHVSSKFDFEAATPEARIAWMEPRAEQTAKGFANGLNRGAGLSLYTLDSVNVDAATRKIVITARSTSAYMRTRMSRDQREALSKTMCKEYARLPDHDYNIRHTFRVLENDRRQAFSMTLSPGYCSRYLDTAVS